MKASVGRKGLWSAPGDGVLARQGDLILLSTIDERGLLERLLDLLAMISEGGGDGRRFADGVEDLVESDETWGGGQEGQPGPAVVAFGPVGAGLAVTVSGTAWAEVITAHGTDPLVAGQPGMVLRCVVGIPVHAVRGGLGAGPGAGDRTDRFSQLERGTVRAGGLSYHTGLAPAPAAAPPSGEAAPVAGVPLAHEIAAPDGPGLASSEGPGAAALAPAAEEAAGAGERPYPVEPPTTLPDAVEPPTAEPVMADRTGHGEPVMAEPVMAEPVMAEPVMAEPVMAEPVMAEPVMVEPVMAEPGTAETETVEPAAAEPVAMPQAGPVRPLTQEVRIPDFGAAQTAEPSGDAVPAGDAAGTAEVPPLPFAGAPGDGAGAADAPIVLGVYCKNGHFGDPNARYCAVCGASRNRRGPAPQPGPRPPLGVLVLDDDSVLELSADCVVGREPTLDPSVAAGEARPLCITDEAVSRIHARVHLDGWRVFLIDLGSANGTRIRPPGKRSDQALEPHVPVPLQSGTHVLVGRQGFRYESQRGR